MINNCVVYWATFSPSRRSSGHLYCCFSKFSDKCSKKNRKKSKKKFCFPKQLIPFPKILPWTRKMQFRRPPRTFWKRSRKFWLKIRYWWNKKFSNKKFIYGNINCSFDNYRWPFNEGPKTFRAKSQNDKQMCTYFWKKNSLKEIFWLRRSHFELFPIKFRTIFAKLFAQKFQQKFSLDKLM